MRHRTSTEHRRQLAKMVMKLFDHWGLSRRQQAMVLGYPSHDQWTIHGLRNGRALSPNADVMERVGHLLAIHRLLRILFPHQRELAYRWMMTFNAAFGDFAPITLVFGWGLYGLVVLRAYLERQTQV